MRGRADLVLLVTVVVSGCTVGPDYHRAPVAMPGAFKEAPQDWKAAAPQADIDRGAWWRVFHDPLLDGLEAQVVLDNQQLKASEAAHRQALALVAQTRSGLFPTLALPDQSQSSNVTGSQRVHEDGATQTRNTASIATGWEIDLWGKIRRQIESKRAAAQATAADLASLRLSMQADLASDYIALRYQDSLQALLDAQLMALTRSRDIVANQYRLGAATSADLAAAQTQLETTRAQAVAVGVDRAKDEHAIALLIGKAPADLSIPVATLSIDAPEIPVTVPSRLLERRPDIAAAERQMQSQNALIGVAKAAYFPDIKLTAALAYAGPGALFTSANQLWGLGANAGGTLLDAGGRAGGVASARAAYDQSVANYRETVLAAFQQVEDGLSTSRILARQAGAQEAALHAAEHSRDVAMAEYRVGTQPYTAVVSAQMTALTNAQAALQIREARLLASVALLKALGGGWQHSDLAP